MQSFKTGDKLLQSLKRKKIKNLKENESLQIHNFIFTNSTKQTERLYAILDDIDKTAKFTPVNIPLREGFLDAQQKVAFYTDHQIFRLFRDHHQSLSDSYLHL